eukprot:TRINITY_DN8723_c0_g1_i1.p1 TRINITY_DN8723_c0_g1~~TRINITY_DN8723_c0_g1_i1.p1  ORF type:complete len:266 (-),score=27.49 TRINITY_DN8723_c0_g1_i1:426-1223(-)
MVSQRVLVIYSLLIGMMGGVLYSAFESVHSGAHGGRRIRSRSLLDDDEHRFPTLVKSEVSTGEPDGTSIELQEANEKAEEAARNLQAQPRVCGSPAIDGYAHVVPECLLNSPTAKAWRELHPQGGPSGSTLACNMERAVSMDGLAVGWGLTNKKTSPEACCQACREHVPGPQVGGPFQNLPCNIWVYCPDPVCFEADAHHHTQGDCWLKFSEAPHVPEINARGDFDEAFRQRHPEAPQRTPWISGVLVPAGLTLTNGTWGPRASW